MNRRNLLKNLGLGLAGGTMGTLGMSEGALAQGNTTNKYKQATKGLPPLKITNVKAIALR